MNLIYTIFVRFYLLDNISNVKCNIRYNIEYNILYT